MRRLLILLAALVAATPALAQFFGGGGGGSGVASVMTACPTAGPITPSSGVLTLGGGIVENAQTGTSYTILAADCGKLVTFSNGGPVAVTLPAAGTTGFLTGFYLAGVQNLGAGAVTITPASGTINGAASIALAEGQSVSIVSDGTNYQALTGKGAVDLSAAASGSVLYNNSGAVGGKPLTGSGAAIVSATGSFTAGDCLKASATGSAFDAVDGSCGSATQFVANYTSGNWYVSLGETGFSAGAANGGNGSAFCAPHLVSPPGFTATALAVSVSTADNSGCGGSACYGSLALYKSDGTGGKPKTLIDYTATFSVGATGVISGILRSPQALSPGIVWKCFATQSTTAAVIAINSSASTVAAWSFGSSMVAQVLGTSSLVTGVSSAYGANSNAQWTSGGGSSYTGWAASFNSTWLIRNNAITPEIAIQVN